jgi:NADH-quinone oxidoreductase subunit L
MPFTFGCMVIGGLALAGVPPFSGFFSKDEILTYVASRGDFYVVLAIVGYIGAFLTAVYTFRMIFRAFFGEPVEEARELEHGHLHHAEVHTNPANGEEEDTDVGFPGPEHHIAEREPTMKAAMSILAVLAIVGGLVQIPGVTHVIDHFLEPTFADSALFEEVKPSDSLTAAGLALGAALGLLGIALAYLLWVKDPELPGRIRARLSGLYGLFSHKWYFDEIIDTLVVRPFAWFGRFARGTFERLVVNGLFVGGTSGAVRAGSSAVRAAQSGFLRYYAALLLIGLAGIGVYFLVAAA